MLTNLDFVKPNIHVKIVRVATERIARKYIIPILVQENRDIKEKNNLKKILRNVEQVMIIIVTKQQS